MSWVALTAKDDAGVRELLEDIARDNVLVRGETGVLSVHIAMPVLEILTESLIRHKNVVIARHEDVGVARYTVLLRHGECVGVLQVVGWSEGVACRVIRRSEEREARMSNESSGQAATSKERGRGDFRARDRRNPAK